MIYCFLFPCCSAFRVDVIDFSYTWNILGKSHKCHVSSHYNTIHHFSERRISENIPDSENVRNHPVCARMTIHNTPPQRRASEKLTSSAYCAHG